MSTPGPPLVLFGTGALACAIGARLARAGERVVLVGSWRAAREAVARRGVVVHDADGTWTARLEAVAPADAPTGVLLALVLVKSHQTAATAIELDRVLPPGGSR